MKRILFSVFFLLSACLWIGCKAPPLRINESFRTNPAAYREIAAVPSRLSIKGNSDKTQNALDMDRQGHLVKTNLAAAVEKVFSERGYSFRASPQPLCLNEDWAQFDINTATTLQAVQDEFWLLSFKILQDRQRKQPVPFHYQMGECLTELKIALGLQDAPAILLMDSSVFLESRMARNKRRGKMALGILIGVATGIATGVAVTPLYESPGQVQNIVALVDGQTNEILWWNSVRSIHINARSGPVLEESIRYCIDTLPVVNPASR
ncbi:MAG: hypothetical protein WCS70_00570 [Verrucomicrobiota bacterium]